MVSTLDFESSDPSSNLGRTYFSLVGSDAKLARYVKYDLNTLSEYTWFYGVMVSTQDSESCDPSSSLGRTSHFRESHNVVRACGSRDSDAKLRFYRDLNSDRRIQSPEC